MRFNQDMASGKWLGYFYLCRTTLTTMFYDNDVDHNHFDEDHIDYFDNNDNDIDDVDD